MIYFQLFLSSLRIDVFSFGGGYAATPLIQNQVVILHGWLSLAGFTDLMAIPQMTPGPIAISAATFVGTRIASTPGTLATTIECVLPSCILVTPLAKIYLRYRNLSLIRGILKSLRPAVAAMIGAAGVNILVTAFWGLAGFAPDLGAINLHSVCIFTGAMILLIRFKMSPILIMVLSGLARTACQLVMRVIQHLLIIDFKEAPTQNRVGTSNKTPGGFYASGMYYTWIISSRSRILHCYGHTDSVYPQAIDKLVLGFVSQNRFSFVNQIAFKIRFMKWAAPHFAFILAGFFRFMWANVSPTFIPVQAFPSICVYRKP